MKSPLLIGATLMVLILTTMASCEGYSCADGVVKDKSTGELLDSVYVNVLSGGNTAYTDSAGAFNICNKMGGCMPKCKDIMIEFSKAGYKSTTAQEPETKTTIFLGWKRLTRPI